MNAYMEKLSMCRICLSDVLPLCSIVNTHLHEMYECLTKMPFITEGNHPIVACDECCASLENCYELRRRCLSSEEQFAQLLRSNLQVHLQIMPCKDLQLGDVVQKILVVYDNVAVKQEDDEDERGDSSAFVHSEDVTASCSFIKVEIDTGNEISDDAAAERGDVQLYYNALGLHTECDIPLDVVKEEPQPDAGAPVSGQHRLDTPPCEDTHSSRKTNGAKDQVQNATSSDKKSVRGKLSNREIMDASRSKTDITLNEYSGSDSTAQHNDVRTDVAEHKVSAAHSTVGSRNKPKSYTCEVCLKCFIAKKKLTRHMHTHTGEKPFKCNVCEKCFKQKYDLSRHILTHSGEKQYQCKVCEKYFCRKDNLNMHIRSAHTADTK